ncbi:hypothetical protein [Sandaracinus amylolyticus]|uniref:hypothetical protein n=1 Tax=Sandaracinus amylolyticus TaxID=927083 RepID=UPI001F1CEA63|nr:hypothetical protein [Sandaracinus amylolyticus]UJR83192.1 Hypothetical protein I5071_52580 [Sandaracinus amylolyticus]
MRAPRAILPLLAIATLVSCGNPLTELVVVITSDVTGSISSVSIQVTGPDGELLDTHVPQEGAPLEWPLTLGLTRSGAPHHPLTIDVRGDATIGSDAVQLQRRVVTGFVPGERRLLEIHLDAACDTPCVDEIDPEDLPPFDGEIPPFDPSCAAEDLGSALGTFARALDRDTSRPASCEPGAGHDRVFRWRAPSTGRFVIDTLPGSNVDSVIDVRRECGGPSIACQDDVGPDRLWSHVEVDLDAGETILVYVYGYFDDAPFDLTFSAAPLPAERCTGGVDDDRDATIDCADPDCDGDAACL